MKTDATLTLDVFGKRMLAVRSGTEWKLFQVGSDGKRMPIESIAIPAKSTRDEVVRYLGDLFHEWATESHPDVRVLR